MKLFSLVFIAICLCVAQDSGSKGRPIPPGDDGDHMMHQQRDALIKADHKKNVEEAAALLKLAEDLKSDLEKDDPQIVSVKSMRKTEEIEKLAKSIRGRLKRF